MRQPVSLVLVSALLIACAGRGVLDARQAPAALPGVPSVTPKDSGLTFELGGCQRDGDVVECRLDVISHAIDRYDRIDCSGLTRAVDERGRSLTCQEAQLGGKPTWGLIGTEVLLVKNARVALRVRFENTQPGAASLSLLRISFADDLVWTPVDFKDVPVRDRPSPKPPAPGR